MAENETLDAKPVNSYTCVLTREQIEILRMLLIQKGFTFQDVKYAHFGASGNNVSLTLYRNRKLLIQGKGTVDFIKYLLEPEVLKEVRFGYEHVLNEKEGQAARIGVDESGKGDYFGPLVVAGLYADDKNIKLLYDLRVKESKVISDNRARKLTEILCSKFTHSVVIIGPEKYNVLYDRMLNLNKMLAWGHARVIENLLSKVKCKQVIIDKFADKSLVKSALMKKGRRVEVEQKVRAEEDIVVAAASVIARGKFLSRLERLGQEYGVELPTGASAKVLEAGRKFIEKRGIQQLTKVGKLHFKTTQKILEVEEPPTELKPASK